ncbi:calcium permeable stress-gated cation channel 1 [Dorcoceras hygrometricum]|uniref:Calcium permeable stress-gated cation channel 1 n=1 Tax=Dorcoceras hygrometricum TaxID=472368 RepID=A0A2Z6ZTL5_9LAMI|nr:calcium permeable stress-gated cation channel 1 [Dorcoceras hygrometricum]
MQQRRAMVVQQWRTMETRIVPLARDERSNAVRPTRGQRATSRPSSRKGAAQNQRTIGQPPPRNRSPKQHPPATHRARPSRDNRASARALAHGEGRGAAMRGGADAGAKIRCFDSEK